MVRGAAIFVLLSLAACGRLARDGDGERIEIGGNVFTVERRGARVEVSNASTGILDQGELMRHAEAAAVMATGCDVAAITQRLGVNTYDARLDC